MKIISTEKLYFEHGCFVCLSQCVPGRLPGGRGGGDGAPSQGHLVDVVVSGAVQVGKGEVGASGSSHWG